jgi:hypothetical protein
VLLQLIQRVTEMRILVRFLIFFLVTGLMVYFYVNRSAPVSAPGKPVAIDRHPDLTAIFTNDNYQQWIDRFGTVSRSAFDASGKRIGTQVGHAGGPTGFVVEMTYLEPDTDHPLGQAFDGAGNPTPLHIGPETPDRDQQGRLVS